MRRLSGCANYGARGRPALQTRRVYTKRPHLGLNQNAAPFWLRSVLVVTASAVVLMGMGVTAGTLMADALVGHTLMGRALSAHAAALRVFGGLQVANFDVFLGCTHIVSCPAALG
jgi:hypothetical protein